MSLPLSAVAPNKPQNVSSDNVIVRCTAEYTPSLWGDRFLAFDTNSMEIDTKTKKQVQELKQEVGQMLDDDYVDKPSQKLCLIDTIQRLGVSYHFETEIDKALQHIHNNSHDDDSSCDLYIVALRFRLLRQQGYPVSCDVFNKFVDNKCEFKESLANDVRGMLELYQATHLRVHGEDVLEKALAFATKNLKSCLASGLISGLLAEQVSYALKQPLHKGAPRLEHRYYIDNYQQDPSHNEQLLTFAKLDFNILQNLHLKELSDYTRWWKDLDLKTKLPYARDRLVECYLWIMFTIYEPRYELGRRMVTKVVSLASILDDTFDNYGTIEELEIFTKAIKRWDIAALDELPEYMHILYATILEVYREIEEEMIYEGKSYAVIYAKEAIDQMEDVVGAYLKEAKWYNKDYTPTLEEYLSVTSVSSTYPLLTIVAFLGMGDFATKEAFEWFLTFPKSLMASCTVCRLMDDIVSHEFEQKRGHVVSSVECYMKQHGVKERVAVDELNKRVIEAWKDINEECLKPNVVPMPLLAIILNFTRVMDVFYKYHDGYTNPEILLKDFVIAMFGDSVPM